MLVKVMLTTIETHSYFSGLTQLKFITRSCKVQVDVLLSCVTVLHGVVIQGPRFFPYSGLTSPKALKPSARNHASSQQRKKKHKGTLAPKPL